MIVVIAGANGLIGSAIGARLAAEHTVIGAVRPGAAGPLPLWMDRRVEVDASASPEEWRSIVSGADAVINCMGALQDGWGPENSLQVVHLRGAEALFDACQQAGVRRVIHFSAIGVDRQQLSDFSRTKRGAEEALATRELEWVILRPSVVLGEPVFGASAQFRGLSALPISMVPPDAGALQVVQLDDVVETVQALLHRPDISRRAFDLAGPEQLAFADVVDLYRRWHGWRPVRPWRVPRPIMKLAFTFGDFLGMLGWRPALRSNASRELVQGAVGDNAPWRDTLGIEPQSLSAALTARPVTVQDRWFAKLFFLKPLALMTFALFWIATGLISIVPGYEIGVAHMLAGGAGDWSGPVVIAGGLADLVIGGLIAFRRTARLGLWAAFFLSLSYAVIGTLILPVLWIEPLGPMMKIWPIICLNLFLLATLEER
jgi:uncharacterized protein YbjT (DUF2867 family)